MSWNAAKHGLRSNRALLPDEDPESYAIFRAALLQDLSPVGTIEELLADRMVAEAWRLLRADRVEADLLTKKPAPPGLPTRIQLSDLARKELGIRSDPCGGPELRHEHAGSSVAIAPGQGSISAAFELNAAPLTLCLRYRAAASKAMLRLLHEFERRQRMRLGEAVAAPVAVDVELDLGAMRLG